MKDGCDQDTVTWINEIEMSMYECNFRCCHGPGTSIKNFIQMDASGQRWVSIYCEPKIGIAFFERILVP